LPASCTIDICSYTGIIPKLEWDLGFWAEGIRVVCQKLGLGWKRLWQDGFEDVVG